MKPVLTWILIADSAHARVLENRGPERGVAEVPGMQSTAELPKTHDMMTDRLPRGHESANASRHAIEPHSDPREALKRAHLETVAQQLDAKAAKGAFDRLIVVAPPHALGTLREVLSARVTALVTAEVGKDLAKTPDHEIAAHLSDVIRL